MSPEREAAIRAALDSGELVVRISYARDLLAALDEAREEAAQWHRKAQQTDDVRLRDALLEREHMQRERDEARDEVERLRALLPPAAHTGVRNGPGEGSWAVFAAKVVAERDEARTQLAALRHAVSHAIPSVRAIYRDDDGTIASVEDEMRGTADAAVAHDRRVRAEAVREASRWLLDYAKTVVSRDNRINPRVAAKKLRARADEIERGER